MVSVPESARVACWLNAWLAGRESTDAVISGLHGRDRLADFTDPDTAASMPPALFLGDIRRRGVRRASTALPVPGDPVGLGGPGSFNVEALDASQAVVFHGPDLGAVPTSTTDVTTWRLMAAHPPTYLPSVAEADQVLRRSLADAADRLADLDVASWRPEVADALLDLRRPTTDDEMLPFASHQAARLAYDGVRATTIVALARADDGGAVSANEAVRRATALQPLDRAARAALVAATSSLDGR